MSAESWQRRLTGFSKTFISFDDITAQAVAGVLAQAGYRFPKDGLAVVMEAKRLVTTGDFTWDRYLRQAEQEFEADF